MSSVKESSAPEARGIKDSLWKAQTATKTALDMKALSPVALELIGLVAYTDYFVICSGTSSTHVGAIVDTIEKTLRGHRVKPKAIEGRRSAHWVLLDYGDLVVHVFDREARMYYELEKLWLDAPRVEVNEDTAVLGR